MMNKNGNVICRLQESSKDWKIKVKIKKYLKNNEGKCIVMKKKKIRKLVEILCC